MMAVVDVRQWDAVVRRAAGGCSDDGAARATRGFDTDSSAG